MQCHAQKAEGVDSMTEHHRQRQDSSEVGQTWREAVFQAGETESHRQWP